MYNFSLTDNQTIRLCRWTEEQNRKAVAAQRANPPNVPEDILQEAWESGFPYGGAIGGSLTFSFTPTSLGVVIKVTDAHTNETIDLTDYEDW